MTLKDELIASRNEGGAGIMLVTARVGIRYVSLDAQDNIITLDPSTVTYGGEFGLRSTEAT